jgi:hypothetical protein
MVAGCSGLGQESRVEHDGGVFQGRATLKVVLSTMLIEDDTVFDCTLGPFVQGVVYQVKHDLLYVSHVDDVGCAIVGAFHSEKLDLAEDVLGGVLL